MKRKDKWRRGMKDPPRRPGDIRSEDLGSAFQGLPDTPCERNADESPEQCGLDVEATSIDAERTGLHRRSTLCTRGLKLGDLFSAHVPLGVDRLDQIVANKAGDSHRT